MASEKEHEELVDIYDDELRKVGVVSRYEAHLKGDWHFNFHCWVVTHRMGGSILFQVRARSKPSFPGMLDSTVGGHYKAGEKAPDVAREIKEEIGLEPGKRRFVHLGRRLDVASYGGVSKREIAEVFMLLSDRPIGRYELQEDEVNGLLEISIRDGLDLFCGKKGTASARGIERTTRPEGPKWRQVIRPVASDDFVPKMDSYYSTLFIMAKRFLGGERYLSI